MNVNSANSAASIYDLSQASGAQGQKDGVGPAVSTQVSDMAGLMNQLQQLSQSNPAEFKQATAAISDQLKQAASQTTGPQAQFLTQLSDRFAQASQSGDLSALQPPKPQHGGHHHGHHPHAPQQPSGATSVESIISDALQSVNAATAT
ncbi:MAG: hypothetical protein QM723_34490 [Myxococcaceae bacterium]